MTFSDTNTLKKVVTAIRAEGRFVVSGDFDLAKIITVVNAPHELRDSAVLGALSKYGKIVTHRRLKYKSYDIYYGIRQVKLELNEGASIPSTIHFGSRYVWIRYAGQTRTCLKCQSTEHTAEGCDRVRCNRCFKEGHKARECENQECCIICSKDGHSYNNCPSSYSNRTKSSQNTEPTEPTPKMTTTTNENISGDQPTALASQDLFESSTNSEVSIIRFSPEPDSVITENRSEKLSGSNSQLIEVIHETPRPSCNSNVSAESNKARLVLLTPAKAWQLSWQELTK